MPACVQACTHTRTCARLYKTSLSEVVGLCTTGNSQAVHNNELNCACAWGPAKATGLSGGGGRGEGGWEGRRAVQQKYSRGQRSAEGYLFDEAGMETAVAGNVAEKKRMGGDHPLCCDRTATKNNVRKHNCANEAFQNKPSPFLPVCLKLKFMS